MRELQKFVNQINKGNKLDKIILVLINVIYLLTWLVFAYFSEFKLVTNFIWLAIIVIVNIVIKKHDAKKIDLAIMNYLNVPTNKQDQLVKLISQANSALHFVELLKYYHLVNAQDNHDDVINFYHKFNEIKSELS